MRWCVLIGLVLGSVACQAEPLNLDLRKHVLAFDEQGRAVDPVTRERIDREGDVDHLDEYVRKMLDAMELRCEVQAIESGNPVRKILLYVHGGLNSSSASRQKAAEIIRKMQEEDDENWHYPVFITWPSGGASTYWEHLTSFRQGQTQPMVGAFTSPLFLLTDLGLGVARAPRSLTYQLYNDTALGVRVAFDRNWQDSWAGAEALYEPAQEEYDIVAGEYERGFWTQSWRFVRYLVTLPLKIGTQTLAVDAMGQGAWEVMQHRIRNLFRRPGEFEAHEDRGDPARLRWRAVQGQSGGLSQFLERLVRRIADGKTRYEITLVGHSMGAIVLNQALPLLPQHLIRRIIYMAPACSIQEGVDAIVPFLKEHPRARFHLLTLHPLAEVDEVPAYDLVPRGSLLEWVDQWYTAPTSHTDRRLGKWNNFLAAIHLFRDVQKQMTAKAFSAVGEDRPQEHGEFNEVPFWRQPFWDPAGPLSYPRDD